MVARDLEYVRAVEALSDRNARSGRLKAVAGGLLIALVLGAFLFTWLTEPNASGLGLLLFGALVVGAVSLFLILPGLSQGEAARGLLAVEPMAWFTSPSDGLVVVTSAGVFLERGLTSLPFDSFAAQFISGAAYLEESHRLRLQLLLRVKSVETQEIHENPEPRDIRLPGEFSPERALELALEMNARAYELRH